MKHWLLPHPLCKVQEQFPAHIAQLQDQGADNIPMPFKSTKGRGGKKSGKGKQKSQQQPQPPPPPLKKRKKRQIIIITMKTTEVIIQATDPTGANKAVVENLIEAPNTGEGASKTIIGDNTKATMGNITPPTEAVTIIIIMVIIKVEVDSYRGHGHGQGSYQGHNNY